MAKKQPIKKRTRTVHQKPLAELRLQLSLSVPEAMRLSGFGRDRVNPLFDAGAWKWFYEGARKRIVTESVIEYLQRSAKRDMGAAA